jgi:hypothetical protein
MNRPLEYAYWKSVLLAATKPAIPIVPFVPRFRESPARKLDTISAWAGIEAILADLIQRFDIGTRNCLEFGVEFGFSTVALSSFFDQVTGVDIFTGDEHTVNQSDIYDETVARLAPYDNIRLIKSDYRDFIRTDSASYDLIHVDIVHTFAATFECGLWSANHSKCTIFHDTESFPAVKQSVLEIARSTGKTFYNFKESFGLGILV